MKATLGREKYLAIALASASVLLAGVLIWEWQQGLSLERDLRKLGNIPVTPVPPQNILPEFKLPPEETGFPELVSRSLFSLNRRSSAVAAKGGVSAMKKGQFVLVGVLITPRQKSALLRDVQTNKTETVAAAAVVRGMTLGDVESSRVVLRQGTDSEELILNVQTGPKPPVAGRAPTPGGLLTAAAPPPPPPAASASAASSAAAASAPAHAASGANPPASAPGGPGKPGGATSAPQAPPGAQGPPPGQPPAPPGSPPKK